MQARRGFVGRSVERLEDAPLLAGTARFIDDLSFPGQIHMRIVRSSQAHARLLSVEAAAARAASGVVAVWTAADIPEVPAIDFRDPAAEALLPFRQPVLARDRVRYVGEPIAAVFADSDYAAEDAAALVDVSTAELPVQLSAAGAPGEFAPGRNSEPIVLESSYGDVPAAFASADAVVELELAIGRHSGVPLETRGALARYDPERDLIELFGAAKVPHRNRDTLMRMLGRAVHLHELHVGGGFGIRGELYPEDVLACVAAVRLGRPVKWIEDRREHLTTANHSRQQSHRVRAAFAADGTLLALDDEFFHDQGAYVRTHGARVVDMTIGMMPGPYRVPSFRARGHFRLTNKTPAATYRAPGRYEGSFVRERVMDAAAARLGIDPIALRRRNLVAKDEMPYARPLVTLGTQVVMDSGDYALLLDKALERFGWAVAQDDMKRRRHAGGCAGLGLACFVEKTGLGPRDGVRLRLDGAGNIEIVTGGASLGQGFETVMAQICAHALGIDYRRMRVVHGQTDRIAHGVGAHASRATVLTGSAVHVAACALRETLLGRASELLQARADELDLVDDKIVHRQSGASIALAALAGDDGIETDGWFEVAHMTYPYGVHIAQVSIDRDTGGISVERYLVAYDVGRAVNPMMIEGQIRGGVMQGLGGALYEEFVYDANGQPLSVTFADYLMPTACEAPPIEVLLTEDAPSPLNPLGLKGAGEAGTTAAGAAIASAIDDALGSPGAVTQLPVTPERILALLQSGTDP